jgi:hypothetical protein
MKTALQLVWLGGFGHSSLFGPFCRSTPQGEVPYREPSTYFDIKHYSRDVRRNPSPLSSDAPDVAQVEVKRFAQFRGHVWLTGWFPLFSWVVNYWFYACGLPACSGDCVAKAVVL